MRVDLREVLYIATALAAHAAAAAALAGAAAAALRRFEPGPLRRPC